MTNEEFSSLFNAIQGEQKEAETKAGFMSAAKSCKDIFDAYVAVGFSEDQALFITTAMITAGLKNRG